MDGPRRGSGQIHLSTRGMANIAGFDPQILCAWSNTGVDRDITKHSSVNQRRLIKVVFRLHKPPELSRYDETGLIWLLEGREVVALTEETAAIRWAGGSITTYRKNNKPALGPLGESPDELR